MSEPQTNSTAIAGSSPVPRSAIFVIVLVSYDYYRFQDNLGATASLETAREIATMESKNRGYDSDLPIIEDAGKSQDMDSSETRHIWIESFPQNERGLATAPQRPELD